MGFTLLFYCTVFNASDIFLWSNNDNKWLEHVMINQQSHISPKTVILEKMFNMCMPTTSITFIAMQCNAMQCNAMQCNAMQCNAMQCNAMQCNAMQCSTMQCNTTQYNDA